MKIVSKAKSSRSSPKNWAKIKHARISSILHVLLYLEFTLQFWDHICMIEAFFLKTINIIFKCYWLNIYEWMNDTCIHWGELNTYQTNACILKKTEIECIKTIFMLCWLNILKLDQQAKPKESSWVEFEASWPARPIARWGE